MSPQLLYSVNYTYITTLAMFGNLTLDPQVREGGREGEG